MGFENSFKRILNLDRRAAWQQRVKQQSQVQNNIHSGLILANPRGVKPFFTFLTEVSGLAR